MSTTDMEAVKLAMTNVQQDAVIKELRRRVEFLENLVQKLTDYTHPHPEKTDKEGKIGNSDFVVEIVVDMIHAQGLTFGRYG